MKKFKPESCKRRNSYKICYCTHIYPFQPRGAVRCIAVFPYHTLAMPSSECVRTFSFFRSLTVFCLQRNRYWSGLLFILLRCYAIFFHSILNVHFHFLEKQSTLEILCMIQLYKIDFFSFLLTSFYFVARQQKTT